MILYFLVVKLQKLDDIEVGLVAEVSKVYHRIKEHKKYEKESKRREAKKTKDRKKTKKRKKRLGRDTAQVFELNDELAVLTQGDPVGGQRLHESECNHVFGEHLLESLLHHVVLDYLMIRGSAKEGKGEENRMDIRSQCCQPSW